MINDSEDKKILNATSGDNLSCQLLSILESLILKMVSNSKFGPTMRPLLWQMTLMAVNYGIMTKLFGLFSLI